MDAKLQIILCNFAVDMRKIDRETTQRILDAADIVEVVSDFVSLKKRGANYIGLCPFHNERTPSFSVSRSKGICKCFSCGKGGSPVNFLMELENMTFQEALRWLANKYHIEIKEREVSDSERQAEQERESMLAVNDFAMKHFEQVMADTEDGRNIGMAYFRERGINETSCKKFHLGYSLEKGNDLYNTAIQKGFSEKFLIATGLCSQNDKGVYDRFRGRVIYPVFSVSGRVVAFGGRTLRTDKSMAKYVNSPESIIYSKSRELYGLYQAKQAITRHDKCILVEGYMDVISMHQSGVENVVASSGTSLTEGQIRLIRRFTKNVTVIYDSDAAGIKASLRGIDMLLAEGMNVKVLSLPDGDDPDSFAQTHTNAELEAYLSEHETDFIRFKSDILLADSADDPLKRADAIRSIVTSISQIPDPITRQVYTEECSRRFAIDDKILSLQIDKNMAENAEEAAKREAQKRTDTYMEQYVQGGGQRPHQQGQTAEGSGKALSPVQVLAPFEREVLRLVLRYGVMHLCEAVDENDKPFDMNVLDFIRGELADDGISFADAAHGKLFESICQLVDTEWTEAVEHNAEEVKAQAVEKHEQGVEQIRREASDLSDIKAREISLDQSIEEFKDKAVAMFARHFIDKTLCSDPDDDVRRLANELAIDRYTLSKVHTKYAHINTEEERLQELAPRVVYELKNAILVCRIAEVKEEIKAASADPAKSVELSALLQRLMELNALKGEFAKYLGERIITPTKL